MISTTVELRTVEGTQAAMGWAGGHTIVVDRPEGRVGGLGLGFNGAQLLALAIADASATTFAMSPRRWA
jgi:hypothetical protein